MGEGLCHNAVQSWDEGGGRGVGLPLGRSLHLQRVSHLLPSLFLEVGKSRVHRQHTNELHHGCHLVRLSTGIDLVTDRQIMWDCPSAQGTSRQLNMSMGGVCIQLPVAMILSAWETSESTSLP